MYDVIVNCCGMGARQLVKDNTVEPIRGQVLRVSQLETTERIKVSLLYCWFITCIEMKDIVVFVGFCQ